MTTTQNLPEDLERIRNFRIMDNDFMNIVFDGHKEIAEEVLRIILEKEDLSVTSLEVQKLYENYDYHESTMDIVATDKSNRNYNIEIQRSDKGASKQRARFHHALIDAKSLERGQDYGDLPDNYVIFITENDVLKKGLPIYHIERIIYLENKTMQDDSLFKDGSHIIYLNGERKDGKSPIELLIHDFYCSDPKDIYNQTLKERVHNLKTNQEEVNKMCRSLEQMRDETVKKEQESRIKIMLSRGKTPDEIVEFCEYPKELVLEVQSSM